MIEPGIAMSKRHLNRHTNGQGMEKYSRQADGLSYIGIMIGAVIGAIKIIMNTSKKCEHQFCSMCALSIQAWKYPTHFSLFAITILQLHSFCNFCFSFFVHCFSILFSLPIKLLGPQLHPHM